jgi:hypothetical protein
MIESLPVKSPRRLIVVVIARHDVVFVRGLRSAHERWYLITAFSGCPSQSCFARDPEPRAGDLEAICPLLFTPRGNIHVS